MSQKPNPRLQKIQSLLRRSDWKQAYKETKFLAKQSNDPELQPILVSSLWNWIKEQVHRGQREEASSNVRELLTYENISSEIRAEFPPVFRSLGLNSLLPEDLREDVRSPVIQIELVDLFLLRNETSSDLLPESLADAKRIREAFQKIEAKQDSEALELLRPISFRSPLADWRLFLRGLIDYYQDGGDKSEESWKRLSPTRPPFRIAEKLRKILVEGKSPSSTAGFFSLYHDSSNPEATAKTELLDSLRSMEQYLDQRKYKELVGRFQSFRSRFRETEPILCERLLRLLQQQLVRDASPDVVRQFVERNLPLPHDPSGNRTFAFLSNNVEDSPHHRPGWLKLPPYYWNKFVGEDIDRIASFSPKMKARAKAIVYDFIAGETMAEFFDAQEELDDFEDLDAQIDVQRTTKEVDDLLEKAIAADPSYPPPYFHQQQFFLQSLPEKERKPFHPKLAEINERLLEQIPEDVQALEFLLNYHLEHQEPVKAKPYFERIKELEPLSRHTLFLRQRLATNTIRQGLKLRDFSQTGEGIDILNDGPPLESMLYRFDLLPLALSYLNGELQGKGDGIGIYSAVADQMGIEKRLPLLFAILIEGLECDAPEKILAPLKAEWTKTISGRCNGNTAGALGDLAYNVKISQGRFLKANKLTEEAAEFVNRAGQVKWKSEKDLFGACNLLWFLAVEQDNEQYGKTFETLAKKGAKQFPKSPYFAFFEAETFWMNSRCRSRLWNLRQAVGKYEDFLKRFGSLRNDPETDSFIFLAEARLRDIDDGGPRGAGAFGGFHVDSFDDEEDWEDDDDDFDEDHTDNPFGFPPGFEFPPEVRRLIQQQGGFTPDMRKDLERSLPKEAGPFRKLLVDVLEESILKNIPVEKMKEVFQRKLKNLSPAEQVEFGSQIGEDFDEDDEDWDDDETDDPGFFPGMGRSKKKTTKKAAKKTTKKKR